jgi:large subunit ribosomal protein L7/L12
MNEIDKIVDKLSNLTVLEAVKLVTALEKKWNVSSNSVSNQAFSVEKKKQEKITEEEKNDFDVILKATGVEKIKLIRAVKEITGSNLKEAKDKVDSLKSSPIVLQKGIGKDEAMKLKKRLVAIGAEVEVK